MKKNKYIKLFGWLAAVTLLLTTSCKDDLFGDYGSSDEVTVSFTLAPEAAATVRGIQYEDDKGNKGNVTYPEDGEFHHISDGSRADMLIYAVYDGQDNLLEGYSNGTDEELKEAGFDHGDGQTIKKIDHFPYTVTLTLKRGTEYTVAFWAQSSKTKAYNTSDLKKVEVIYSELSNNTDEGDDSQTTTSTNTTTPNNDEYRDAFCRSLKFVAGEGGLEQNVLLYRPLAQINVGTSGFDFETITRNAQKKYTYSKIRLNRVARYLDVVKDKTYSTTTDPNNAYSEKDEHKTPESFAVADFGYAPIPAYVNYEGEDPRVPEYPSYTIWDWDYNDDFTHPKNLKRSYYAGEEFLKVHLKKEGDGKTYTGDSDEDGYADYANMLNNNEMSSETFKYLSMCYVLTSSTKEDKILINNVKVWMATDEQGTDEIQVVDLNNVPAQRNWRTNIVGSLLTEETIFDVTLDKDFAGEYNGWAVGDDWEWSGELADGVYYDAVADEILISNANGLLWFQRMVNGTMTVRKVNKEVEAQKYLNGYYPYYVYSNGENTEKFLKYDGISDPTEGIDVSAPTYAQKKKLRDRILKATHQDNNPNSSNEWPEHNNFHFCGTNGPAKVKLMADIDLKGIEWIPIGFDFKIHDTTLGSNLTDDGGKNYWNFDESKGEVRAFCGQFDGNNHTVSNLANKRFTAWVHKSAEQDDKFGPYDNVQWFPAGFFGMVGGCGVTADEVNNNPQKEYTKISNLRLFNVDVYGYHTAAAIAGIVNSVTNKIDIINCMVDGGTIELSPMYRGDVYREKQEKPQTRTFARGIYLGGIVGQYVADGHITGCVVRNVDMRGYRQIGGLVGSVSNKDQKELIGAYPESKFFTNLKIEDNRIENLLIIANKFQPYDSIFNSITKVENNIYVWKNGFGWKSAQGSLANPFVGGTVKEVYTNNSATSVQFTEFSTNVTDASRERKSTIGAVPLEYIPMLSSWFCDEISLTGNYYGKTSVHTGGTYYKFKAYSWRGDGQEPFSVPFNLPYTLSIDYAPDLSKAAMYVESVTLNGYGNPLGHRSVITPEGVDDKDACVMYVTSRNRKQFHEHYLTLNDQDKDDYTYKKPTIIKNVVLRGAPYAWAGILLAPNENMEKVRLDSVAIYDVYQTIALDNRTNTGGWPNQINPEGIDIEVNYSNFRGYTVPGAGWNLISYKETTFEEGTSTGHGPEERTYKVEAPTTFNKCYFKAPYIIDLSAVNSNSLPTFSKSHATASSDQNVEINLDNYKEKGTVIRIMIISSAQGDPIVIHYYKNNGTGYGYDKAHPNGNDKTYDWNGHEIKTNN